MTRGTGLPPPLAAGAAYTSQTCLQCGHAAPENRPKVRREGDDIIETNRFLSPGAAMPRTPIATPPVSSR